MKTKVEYGYVDKRKQGYVSESDFWGTVYTWDINDAEFWTVGCPGTKAIRTTVTYEEHASLELHTGFKGKNEGRVQWVCPRCHKCSNKNRDPEIGKEYVRKLPCTVVTIQEKEW